ncbi:MAG: membrane dipeptidase [Burkholderiales bacterium]
MPSIRVAIPEFDEWTKWSDITAGLLGRGWSETAVRGFVGENWLRFLRRTVG